MAGQQLQSGVGGDSHSIIVDIAGGTKGPKSRCGEEMAAAAWLGDGDHECIDGRATRNPHLIRRAARHDPITGRR